MENSKLLEAANEPLNITREDDKLGQALQTTNVVDLKKPGEDHVEVLSKKKLKKLKRKQDWEAGREARKVLRREKIKEKKAKKRAALQEAENGLEVSTSLPAAEASSQKHRRKPVQVPVTIVFDCQYDDLMTDNEQVSLSGQLTRSYSENRKSPFRAHLIISSFGGSLKNRFDGILAGHYHSWHSVRVIEGDFVEAATQAQVTMTSAQGGRIGGALSVQPKADGAAAKEPLQGEVIYLSSDSPNTLSSLRPNGTYIIGGLVDRNRHKGACYKKAMDAGVQTAKLPIGEFLQLQSRTVLTTNHVCQILLKWLELGDWGKAFMEVVPKRKGGVLKNAKPEIQSAFSEEKAEEEYCSEEDGAPSEGNLRRDSPPVAGQESDENGQEDLKG